MDRSFFVDIGSADSAFSQPHMKGPRESPVPAGLPPPPQSSVDKYGLTFGTVCGICAGVFVKRGAKALAFVFGGIFVMLQVSCCLNDLVCRLKAHHKSINSILVLHP